MSEQDLSARVTINLSALRQNYQRLAAKAGAAKTAAAIKADAYGLGLEPCARTLWQAGCRSFFVARPREGKDLRAVLPEAQIYVLDGLYAGQSEYYLRHDLIPSLISYDEAVEWAAHGQGRPCTLHVDTGINRVSLTTAELERVVSEKLPLNIELLMSHLASSEEPHNDFNAKQLERFQKARLLLPDVKTSFANSSGIFLGPDYAFDLVRSGIALYGGNPVPDKPNPMLPVVTLEAQVLQVRDVPKGEATGYNSTWRAQADSRLALLGAGYRDGIPRRMSSSFGGEAKVFLNGQMRPIVGRVSMDMVAVDVTGTDVKRGDWAEFFGSNIALDDAAKSAGTISWELLTHLGSRYEFNYVE